MYISPQPLFRLEIIPPPCPPPTPSPSSPSPFAFHITFFLMTVLRTRHSRNDPNPASRLRPPAIHDAVEVLWEDRDQSFTGALAQPHNSDPNTFLIVYDDGDVLWQNLDCHHWRFVPRGGDHSSWFQPGDLSELYEADDRRTTAKSKRTRRHAKAPRKRSRLVVEFSTASDRSLTVTASTQQPPLVEPKCDTSPRCVTAMQSDTKILKDPQRKPHVKEQAEVEAANVTVLSQDGAKLHPPTTVVEVPEVVNADDRFRLGSIAAGVRDKPQPSSKSTPAQSDAMPSSSSATCNIASNSNTPLVNEENAPNAKAQSTAAQSAVDPCSLVKRVSLPPRKRMNFSCNTT